jgi:hypothetical protein
VSPAAVTAWVPSTGDASPALGSAAADPATRGTRLVLVVDNATSMKENMEKIKNKYYFKFKTCNNVSK